MKRAALLLAAGLLLAGCASADSGRVTKLEFVGAHEEWVGQQCYGYDSKGQCTVQMPIFETVPDCWHVEFHDDPNDLDGDVCVTPEEYAAYRVGDHYPRLR